MTAHGGKLFATPALHTSTPLLTQPFQPKSHSTRTVPLVCTLQSPHVCALAADESCECAGWNAEGRPAHGCEWRAHFARADFHTCSSSCLSVLERMTTPGCALPSLGVLAQHPWAALFLVRISRAEKTHSRKHVGVAELLGEQTHPQPNSVG
jgi:hypothetical protein